MSIITNTEANGSRSNQLFDAVISASRKWFTLSNNKLDGSHHPVQAGQPDNLLDYSTWVVGTSGSQVGFGQNGDGNSIVSDTDPFGNAAAIWRTLNNDATSDADGGWNTSSFAVDPTKLYRFSVWIQRRVLGNGTYFFGCYGRDASDANIGVLNRSDGAVNTNAYFRYAAGSEILGDWFLLVGHIWPEGSGAGAIHDITGVWTRDGQKIAVPADYVWNTGTARASHRTYLYYSTDPITEQLWCYPRVDCVDGTEPTIEQLLSGEITTEQIGYFGTELSNSNGIIADGPNLLVYPDFSGAGWSKSYITSITYDNSCPDGTETINFKDANGDTSSYIYSYGDYAPQEAGETYVVSVWAKVSVGTLGITPYTADNSEAGRQTLNRQDVTSADGWARLVWYFTAPTPNYSDSLSFNLYISTPATAICSMSKPMMFKLPILRWIPDIGRPVHTIRLVGNDLLNEFPKRFKVVLYDGTSVLYQYEETNNTDVVWEHALDATYEPTHIDFWIYSLSRGYSNIKLTELSNPFNVYRSDAALMLLTDLMDYVGSKLSSTDDLKAKTSEVDGLTNTLEIGLDLLLLKLTDDALPVTNSFVGNDDLRTKIAEADSIQNTLPVRSDNLSPKITEADSIQNMLPVRSDNILSRVDNDSISITNSFGGADTLSVKTIDESFFTLYEFWSTDSITTKVVDDSFFTQFELWKSDNLLTKESATVSMTNTFTRTDIVKPRLSELTSIQVSFIRPDVVLIKENIEADLVTISFASIDTLQCSVDNEVKVVNVHTMVDEAIRRIYGKVEVVYTDPFLDATIDVTANQIGRYTYPAQLANNVVDIPYKYFSLHENKLDGSYHTLPSDEETNVGWWGTQLSDSNGSFSTPPMVSIVFSSRAFLSLQVAGDNKLNNYPVDFDINLYSNTTLVYSNRVRNNTQVLWSLQNLEILGVTKLEVIVYKINKANSVVKLSELYAVVRQTYIDELESLELLEEISYTNGGIPIGAVSSNEIDISISNHDKRFSVGNAQSPLYGLLKKNRRVHAWLGVAIDGLIEWHELGTFWTIGWKVPTKAMVAQLTARDRLEVLRGSTFSTSALYVNKSIYWLANLILDDAGLSANEYQIDIALDSVILPYAWFDKMSHRDALQHLMSSHTAQVHCDRGGVIIIGDATPTPTVIKTFRENTNIYDTDFPAVLSEVTNYVEVLSSTYQESASGVLHESTDNLVVPANSEVTKEYKYQNLPAVSAGAPVIVSTNASVKSYTSYAWGMSITFENTSTSAGNVTAVTINGTYLEKIGEVVAVAKDETLIHDDGEIRAEHSHPFIQTVAYAQQLADNILNAYKTSPQDILIDSRGDFSLKLGDRIEAEVYEGELFEYMIKRQHIRWDGSLGIKVEAKKL